MRTSARPLFVIAPLAALLTAGIPAYADRVDLGGVIELTGVDRPNAPTLTAFRCFETAAGLLFTDSEDVARRMALGLRQASLRYQRHFGETPPAGVIITAASIPSDMNADLRKLGVWMLPWPIQDIENSTHADAYMHETGHMWFIRGVWREVSPPAGQSHYGGSAPDWFDETAAILIGRAGESDWQFPHFREALADPDRRDTMLDLVGLFDESHPALRADLEFNRQVAELRRKVAAGELEPGAFTLKRPQADGHAVTDFYARCKMLSEYFISRSADGMIFRDLAANIRDGGTVAGWLEEFGVERGMPGSLDALDADWRAWIESRFGVE